MSGVQLPLVDQPGQSGAGSPPWKAGCASSGQGLSRQATVAKALDYMLTRWERFARFLTDGCICLTTNTAKRAMRGVALGRRAWMLVGAAICAFKRHVPVISISGGKAVLRTPRPDRPNVTRRTGGSADPD